MTDVNTAFIERLRKLVQADAIEHWLVCEKDCEVEQLPTQTFTKLELNEKRYLVWEKGRKVRWFYQEFVLPEALEGYPLAGLTLRLALTWWAELAEVFVNGQKVQEGDLFDHSCRVVLSSSVVPGEKVAVAIRLISPGHDIGGLMRSRLLYESNYDELDPGFVADEIAVIQSYAETFASEETIQLDLDWKLVRDRIQFDQALENLRSSLLGWSDRIKQHTIYLLGHAHLDMAWLWDVEETWRAAERTFKSVLNLQKDFPDLTFCHTTPALYEWIEQNRPELFAQIQAQVKAGTWEIIGGMWVEPEMNLISGEAIARHLLYGQRYWQEKFGILNRVEWLPDTFGFNWQLPQFLRQAGIDYFVTQKLRWNDTNQYPHEIFNWQAPNGSTVFSLMSSPIGEGIDPIKMSAYAWEWTTRSHIMNCLWLFGVGDHGGGPTRDMLELARRWQKSPFFPTMQFTTALNYLDSIAKLKSSSSNDQLSRTQDQESTTNLLGSRTQDQESTTNLLGSRIQDQESTTNLLGSRIQDQESTTNLLGSRTQDQESTMNLLGSRTQDQESTTNLLGSRTQDQESTINLLGSTQLPIWNDELYLEFHRGCYTTHGDQKKFNRECESAIYEAELWASIAAIVVQEPYPKAALEIAWKKILFNQFHDILPGSSITQVFIDANREWEAALRICDEIKAQAMNAIANQIACSPAPHPDAKSIIIFNSLNWSRSQIHTELLKETEGRVSLIWKVCDETGREIESDSRLEIRGDRAFHVITFHAQDIPALGYRCFWLYSETSNLSESEPLEATFILENELLRVEIDSETGEISSLFNKEINQEVLGGKGNRLQAFKDEGQYWDAWNIDPNYANSPLPDAKLIQIKPASPGELRSSIFVEKALKDSRFYQYYSLEKGSAALRIFTRVDWQERHTVVKAVFPLSLETDCATYGIPCGAIIRPTIPQCPEDHAKWEVPFLGWANLSNGKAGVSLLSDCKHGIDTTSNQFRLTLLRGSEFPDPDADRGTHVFNYVIYPHTGDWRSSQTVRKIYELNHPLKTVSIQSREGQGILPHAVSFLDLQSDNLILSSLKQSEDNSDEYILRCYECHGEPAELNLKGDFEIVESLDLLERPIDIPAQIQPWQIRTYKIKKRGHRSTPSNS